MALPWRRGAAPLARLPDGSWVYLKREILYPARWIEGAKESKRRQAAQARHVAALARDALALDPVAIKIRAAGRPPPEPSRRSPDLDLGSAHAEVGRAAAAARQEAQTAPTRQERLHAREMALTERLERMQQHDH